jgi:enhancing lycopene biosynthesis protein 2
MRVGVILCGSGRFDGSEIHESVLTLLHVARGGAEAACFAPDAPQWAVCDHFSGQPRAGETRNMLQESARIARGAVKPLAQARAADLDALILPGGNGAAHNLGSFAEQGAAGSVLPDLERLLKEMLVAGKPIGAICIAPALVALVLGARTPLLTLGAARDPAALEAGKTGARLVDCPVDGIVVDEQLNLVSTPAYMAAKSIAEADAGIGKLVAEVLRRARKG